MTAIHVDFSHLLSSVDYAARAVLTRRFWCEVQNACRDLRESLATAYK